MTQLRQKLGKGRRPLHSFGARQLAHKYYGQNRKGKEHAARTEEQGIVVREARAPFAQYQRHQRHHTQHDQPCATGHETVDAGAPAAVQAAGNHVRPGDADQAIAEGRDAITQEKGGQNQAGMLRAKEVKQNGEDQNDEARRDVGQHEPAFLARAAHNEPRHKELRQGVAGGEEVAGKTDQNLRIGQAPHEVRDHRGRADDPHRHHE